MERPIKRSKVPSFQSIEDMAKFWDSHDSADFEDQLEEMTEPVFERRATLPVLLSLSEANAVRRIAKSKRVESLQLVRQWVLERIRQETGRKRKKA